MKRRMDRLTAILIDAIQTNRPFHSTQTVARAFAKHHVPLEVALRVLTRPWDRRLMAHAEPVAVHAAALA
jgi:RNase P/RNase MRP subunit p30